MAFTDALAVLALAYFAGNALVHVVYALSTLTFVMFAKFIGMRDVEALLYPRLPAMLLPIVRGIVSFSATILWAASAVFLRVLPFLVLCLLLSVLHANAEELLKMFLDVYNNNISHDPLMRYLRHALLGAKLAGHYLLPLYNFVITVFASGTYKLFTLFLDDTNQVLSTSTLNALFQLLGGTYSVLADWVVHNVGECAMSVALIENITATPAHRCVQLGPDAFRALDAARLVGPVQTLATEGAKVLLVTCPAVHRLALVALYPVIEATHLVDALENMLNALLAVVYGMWDVTRLRCAAARATRETADWLPRARTSMCVPDVAPVFLFGSAGLRALGRLFDNWAGMVFKEILALFFMADAPAGGGGGGACQSASERLSSADVQALVQRLDHPQDARLVPVSSALVAASDGRTALFKQLDSEHVARAAFPTPVALRAGFAPVVFVQSAEFADPDGSMQTALLGCRCAAPAHGTGVTLSCSFALYTSGAATQARDVQLHFENEETSAAFASCDELSIRVQPLRFTPRAISDTARRAAFYEAGGLASEVECVRNPAACASADAAIYVTPICRGDTTVCLRGLQNSRCFPYCVGLHQRGAGSAPITLYHYETLDRGVFMTNTDCCASPLLAAAGGAGVPAQTTITDASDPAATTQLSCTLSAIAAFDTREQHACVVTGGSSTADAPPMLPVVDQPNLPRPHVAEFQPVLFAGDSALVPRCRVYIPEQSPEGALEWDCDWGVDVQRLATSLGNEYHVQAVRTDVPGARVGAGAGPPEVTAGTLPLPGAPAQSLAGPLPAALFADGLAYAINPNFDRVKSLIAHKPIFSVAVGELESAAVFVARPRTMCTREQLVYQEHTSSPGDRVLLCAHNMTQRVEFADAHAFIQYSELGSNQPGERNLFVEAVDYYDARNLLVTVRRGRARALCAALGYAGCDADVQPAHTVFYFVHMQNLQVREGSPWVSPVLLHATNYQGLLGCKQDTFLPPLGALLGAVGDVGLTTMRVGVNSFLLNGIGQVDDMLRSKRVGIRRWLCLCPRCMFLHTRSCFVHTRLCFCTRAYVFARALMFLHALMFLPATDAHVRECSQTVVNTGTGSLLDAARFTPSSVRLCHNAFGHHAYEPCSERPLSTAPVLASMQRLFALVHVCARRVVLYLHILTGVAFGEGSWFQNVILTATTPDSGYAILGVDALANAGAVSVGTVFSVLASTVHFGFYFVDDVVLGGVRAVLRHLRTRPSLNISPSDLLMLFAGVLYNTLHDGTYDAKVTTAGGSVCLHLSGAFGDPTLPLGLFAWNACQAAFALHRAALRFAATALSMVGLSDCVCHNTERTRTGELSARCATRIPDAFRAEFDAFVRTSTRASVACERMLEHIEAELNAVPVVLFTHLENAFDALRGVPQQLAAYMHLPVFSELSCASYTSSADSAIMLPRPLSEFRRCAFTQTCAGRCSASFGGFHAAIARSEAEGVQPARPPAASTVQLPVQPWTTPDGWQPVALQHYGAQVVARCSEWMVVLAASARGSGPDGAARGASWHVFGYCFAQGTALQFTRELDVDVTMLVPPKLDVLPLQGAPAGARFALNQAWPTTLPHDGSLRARFLLVVSQVGYANGVLELTVPASGEARASWVFAARDTYALETCDAVTPAARAVLQESVGVSADAEVDFDVQREPHIRQALWFPRAAGAYTVVARVRAHALVGAARYPFELAMRLRVGADGATDCRAFPLLEAEPLHAGARSAHALFEGLLRNARLFANASDNDGHGGEGRLVLLERGEDGLTMREFFPLSDTQAHAEGEAGLLYFNESGDAVHDVQAEGRYAVLNTLPAQYDISARQDTFLNARLYSPVLVDTKLGAHDRGYHLLLSDTTKQTSFDNWFSVFALRHAGHQQLDLLSLSFSAPETVTVSKDCNYMQCEDCRTDELQALCFVAQRCALQRCVGTVINPTNVFCSVGILLRETAMYSGAEEGVLYSMVVEGLLAAVREWQGGSTGTSVIYVQSLSNVYTTIMCDIKNVLAALSALLPSFYATMYRLAQPRRSVQRTSTPPARGDARFEIAATLSPRELIESAGTYFALSQAAFQFLLGIIFNFMHDVEVVTCLVAKFSGVFEQYNVRVEFVHNSGQFLFEGGGSPCEMIFRDDISFSRGQQTTAQNEAFLMDLIRRGGLAVAARPRFQLSTFDLTDVQDAAGSILSATVGAARTFLMLRYSYFIKWVVGLVYGVGGVLMQMQADTCSPTVVIGPEVLGCACGDDPFHIPPERATNSLGWCRGVLELTTTDGLRVHVHNPYEYADLRAKMGLELAILLHEMQADAASDIAGTNAGDVLRDLYVVGLAEAAYNSALKPAYEAVRDFVPGAAQAAAEAIKGALTASAAADLEGPILQELGDPSTAVVSALRDLVASNLVRDAANTVLQSAIIGTDALVSATGIDELLESEQLRASVAAAIDAAVRAAEATATAVGNVAVDTAEVADAGLAAVGGAAEATATAGGIDALSAAHTVALLADPEVRAGTEALVQQVVVQAAAQLRDSEAVTALTEARIELRERLVEAAVGLSQRDATAATADDLLTAQLPLLKGALHGAPAASVFMQCRNNYARRRWDPGAFAAMSRDARDAELRAEYEALVGEHAASEAQRERALQCFRAGNTSNTVEACTQLVFADLAAHFEYTRADEAESFAGAAADAFVGEKTLPAADAAKLRAVATLPDACRLYSAPGLQSVEALRGCATDDHFTSQCERSEATYDTPCETNRVLQYHQGALSVALADSYVVHAARNETELREQAQSRYNKIRNCIRTRFDSVLDNTAALEAVVADLDIAVYSSEGDALHQMLDCTFLGATNSTDLLPNEPPPAAVERMRYAGPPPGEECEGTHVTDVHTSTRELVRTCGSPARVAIVTWFKRQLMANNGEKIRLLLMRRLNELSANITNLENYGCYDSATGNTGLEYCTQDAPWPAAVTDTTIRAEDILNLAAVRDGEEQPGSNFYVHALTNATVRTLDFIALFATR